MKFLSALQTFIFLWALVTLLVMLSLGLAGHWGFWVLLPFPAGSIFFLYCWGRAFEGR